MHTRAALADIHARTQRSLAKLLDHCEGFSAEELGREIDGFGYPTLLLQLHHMIGAERYWVGVLEGKMLNDELDSDRDSIASLRAFRERTLAATAAWFASVSDADVNTRRPMTTWNARGVELLPAHVILRTQTHVFQHQGQVAAMCRLLGRPIPEGLDFPLL